MVDELDRDIDASSLSDQQKPLFHLAKKLTQSPSSVEQEDVQAALSAGRDEDAVFSPIHVCCAFNAINRLVEGLGIEADEQVAEMGAKMIHEKGYADMKDVLEERS